MNLNGVIFYMASLFFISCVDQKTIVSGDISQLRKNDLEKNNLLGEVKHVLENTYSVKDSAGVPIMGEKIKLPLSKHMYFDKDGFTNRICYYSGDELIESINVHYDAQADVIVWKVNLSEDSSRILKRIILDELEREVKVESFNPKETISQYQINKYLDQKIVSSHFDKNDKLISSFINTLDSSGKVINSEFKEGKKIIKTIKYTYNEKNDIKKYVLERKGLKTVKIEFEYKYNELGNWTYRVEYQDNVPVRITSREIKYYE